MNGSPRSPERRAFTIARDILDEFYDLPDSATDFTVEELESRLTDRGLRIISNPTGTLKEVRR